MRSGKSADSGPARTAERILDAAEHIVQTHGYNGFSYADVARELDLTKAALHYHFPGKAELGEALMVRYADRFAAALKGFEEAAESAVSRIEGYISLYQDVVAQSSMCLGAMLAAEYETLPARLQKAVTRFFDACEEWLVNVLQLGQADGSLRFIGSAREVAPTIISVVVGATLLGRPRDGIARFNNAIAGLLRSIVADRGAD